MWFLVVFVLPQLTQKAKVYPGAMQSLLGFDFVTCQLQQALLGSAAYISSVPSFI